MLVCPQCQFENPDDHKFCQKCGASLTEVVCPGCASIVPMDVERCPTCGTVTGVVLRAVIAIAPTPSPVPVALYADTPIATGSPPDAVGNPTPTLYLDAEHRYQVLDPLPTCITTDVDVRVLDRQPLSLPYLNGILSTPGTGVESEVATDVMTQPPTIQPPAIAQPYLALRAEFKDSLPQLYDAWQDQSLDIAILEDRGTLPPLSRSWVHPNTLPLQVLCWMRDMVELWTILAPHGACSSLLEISNLHVDEDSVLCLQQLYFDSPDHPAMLSQLGELWRSLCAASPLPSMAALMPLCTDLIEGKVTYLDDLNEQLGAIAVGLQDAVTAPPLPPPVPPMELDEDDETAALPPMPASMLAATAPPVFLGGAEMGVGNGLTRLELGDLEDNLNEGDDVPTVVLPMKLVGVEDSGRTDVGKQREHNEDFFSIQTDLRKLESPGGRSLKFRGLYILCDGMGGHASGEVASALAVDTLKQYFQEHWADRLPDEQDIRDAILATNRTIFDLNQQSDRSGVGRMGTTLLIALVQDTQVAIAHVGDSRLYRFSRRRGLEQITVDHEVGQREIHRGVEPAIAYARPDAYQLTQALGPRDDNFINPDVQFLELNEDMILLLCSDGLTDNDLLEKHWQTHLEPLLSPSTNLDQGVNQLIELANQHNGHDNITVVAVRVRVRPNLESLKR